MKLADLFEQKDFVVSGEVGPVKGSDPSEAIEGAKVMEASVDVVNVTDNQSAVMRLGSLAVSHLLKNEGIEPVFQLTCRDRNRIALQSDLLSAAALGIENTLLLTGDHMVLGDHPQAKKVFDLDSVQLLAAAKGLNEGRDLEDHELEGTPDLCLGAVVNPGSDEVETQLIKMQKKIDAGAEFFQTQAVYDADLFARFMESAAEFGAPVMVGIVPLKSAGMARYMTQNVAGVNVPDEMVQRMKDTAKPDRKKVSAEMSADLVRKMKDACDGVHIMPLGWDDIVPDIVQGAGVE
ncbi:MAG: methylenetetrahydrofolate reductase [Planctomycetes bacterium]|nr:methylenetetrahydrofolate reductase [Planctomycetota bacterium]